MNNKAKARYLVADEAGSIFTPYLMVNSLSDDTMRYYSAGCYTQLLLLHARLCNRINSHWSGALTLVCALFYSDPTSCKIGFVLTWIIPLMQLNKTEVIHCLMFLINRSTKSVFDEIDAFQCRLSVL